MQLRVEHERHTRRRGRNIGLGLLLAALAAMIFGLTLVKIEQAPTSAVAGGGGVTAAGDGSR